MSKRLDETVAVMEYDGLIVDNIPKADVVSVTLAAGSGTVKRGAVLTGTPGGTLAVLSAAATAGSALYILADDTDTGEPTTPTGSEQTTPANTEQSTPVGSTQTVPALAYRTGHFARGKLIVGEGYSLSAADEELLRKSGILLSAALDY